MQPVELLNWPAELGEITLLGGDSKNRGKNNPSKETNTVGLRNTFILL